MIKNRLKAHWLDNKATLNGWLSINSAFVSEIMADQGFDSLTVDMQHGAVSYEGMLAMLQAMRASQVVPMVRVPWNEPSVIMKALDAGAYGIICPMINSVSQAEEFVHRCDIPLMAYAVLVLREQIFLQAQTMHKRLMAKSSALR